MLTFCEIVHHTRKSFTLEQLGSVVSYLACCVADRSLPFTTQSTCVRLSLNLVECLYQVGVIAQSCWPGWTCWSDNTTAPITRLYNASTDGCTCAYVLGVAALRMLGTFSTECHPICVLQAFKRPDSDLAAKKLAQSLLSKILASFVAKLTALAQVRGRSLGSRPSFAPVLADSHAAHHNRHMLR